MVDSWGASGGLCVAWKSDMSVSLVKYSSFFIHVEIVDLAKNVSWNTILVYASCEHQEG